MAQCGQWMGEGERRGELMKRKTAGETVYLKSESAFFERTESVLRKYDVV